MKPLTLTVFEKHAEPEPPVYRVGGSFTPYAIVATDKRFTDAELAAEFWRSEHDYERAFHGMRYACGNWPHSKFEAYERVAIVERLANLPHYDEE